MVVEQGKEEGQVVLRAKRIRVMRETSFFK